MLVNSDTLLTVIDQRDRAIGNYYGVIKGNSALSLENARLTILCDTLLERVEELEELVDCLRQQLELARAYGEATAHLGKETA